MKTKATLLTYLLLAISIVCTAQRQVVRQEYIRIGSSKNEVITWLKSIGKFYESDFHYSSDPKSDRNWDSYYMLSIGKMEGSLDNKLQLRYIFKSDTCRLIDVIPGTMNNIEEIMTAFKKESDSRYVSENNRVQFVVSIEKKKIQASTY